MYGSEVVLADLSTTPEKPDVPKVIQKTVQMCLQFDVLPTSTSKEMRNFVDDCKSGTRMKRNSIEQMLNGVRASVCDPNSVLHIRIRNHYGNVEYGSIFSLNVSC